MFAWLYKWGVLATAAIAVVGGFVWQLSDSVASDAGYGIGLVALVCFFGCALWRIGGPPGGGSGDGGAGFIGSADQHGHSSGFFSNFFGGDGGGFGGGDGGGGGGDGGGGGG